MKEDGQYAYWAHKTYDKQPSSEEEFVAGAPIAKFVFNDRTWHYPSYKDARQ